MKAAALQSPGGEEFVSNLSQSTQPNYSEVCSYKYLYSEGKSV